MVNLSLIKNNKQVQINTDVLTLSLMREYFSILNPAYRSNKKFIPNRLHAITPSGKFELGLLDHICAYLESNQIQYNIEESLYKKNNNGFKNPTIETLSISYRDYQKKSIVNALKKGKGVISIPTAGGKTLIMAGLIKSFRKNIENDKALTLVIVPSIQLVEQTASDFISYGLKNVTKWSGSNQLDISAEIIVAGTQILLSNKTDLSILDSIELLLMDETHGLRKGNEINKIFNLINTDFKFGFTGTLPPSNIDQWNIFGKLGPVVYEEKTLDLKNQEYVSNFKIVILNIRHCNIPKFKVNTERPTEAYNQEIEYLMHNERRNEVIAKLADRLPNNTIIMVDRIDHGLNLESKLKEICEKNRPIYFIQGSTDIEERENVRNLMNKKNNVIVVAVSKIFSTGINIPNLHNIIFASAGKAKIKIMQSIGRALRLHPTKTMATIFDIADNTKYGQIHLSERIKLYNTEKYNYEEKTI
jgi:superfamily II DNA or RNA helicase